MLFLVLSDWLNQDTPSYLLEVGEQLERGTAEAKRGNHQSPKVKQCFPVRPPSRGSKQWLDRRPSALFCFSFTGFHASIFLLKSSFTLEDCRNTSLCLCQLTF